MAADPGAALFPPFAWPVHDRLAHLRTDEGWLEQAWLRARILLLSRRSTAPVVRDEIAGTAQLEFVSYDDVDPDCERTFLGEHDGVAYFSVQATPDQIGAQTWLGLREVGLELDDLQAGLFNNAVGLANWHANHPRCPRCGQPTVMTKAGWTRTCEADNSEHFPRTDPAVIMLVHDGADRCVLGRQSVWPPGRYSVLAGFVEPGESGEAAVVREVHEEVGLLCGDVRYVASQPWPFPASLMIGYTATVEGSQAIQVDEVEIENARWFTRDEVREAFERAERSRVDFLEPDPSGATLNMVPGRLSIARLLLDRWLAEGSPPA
jgi:NAD+ diphosphatase